MSEDEKIKIRSLSKCSFLPGSFPKKFIKAMVAILDDSPEQILSDKQWYYLQSLYHSYGGQITDHIKHCLICKHMKNNEPLIKLVCPGCGHEEHVILRPKFKPGQDKTCSNCTRFNWSDFDLRRL